MAISRVSEDDLPQASQSLLASAVSVLLLAMRRDVQRAKALLEGKPQRVTPQRVALLAALLGDRSHPTAAQLHTKLRTGQPSLSLATVYKNLATLARVGMVVQVNVPGDDEHFEANLHPHANFVCTSCREITDVDGPPFEEFEGRVRATAKGKIDQVQILIRGTCALSASRQELSRGARCRTRRRRGLPFHTPNGPCHDTAPEGILRPSRGRPGSGP